MDHDVTGASEPGALPAPRRRPALVLAELVQHFGLVEAQQVTLDGGLRASAWYGRPREPVLKWADEPGLDVGG